MKKMFVLAATAMVLATTTTTAFAADQRVKVRGRYAAEIHTDIVAAATSVCREEYSGYGKDLLASCVRETTRDAVRQINSPVLSAYDKTAFRSSGLQKASF